MQLRWSHAFVQVRDLTAMLDFYTGVLGFEVTDRGEVGGRPVAFISQVETDHHQLAFAQRGRAESDSGAEGGAPASGNVGHFAFRVDSLAEVRALHHRLQADDRVHGVSPVTHGNAWSIYFADPEGNGIEVFCDTPWHVRQPEGGTWDPAMSEAETRETTRQAFAHHPGFGPIDQYYRERAEHLARRE